MRYDLFNTYLSVKDARELQSRVNFSIESFAVEERGVGWLEE